MREHATALSRRVLKTGMALCLAAGLSVPLIPAQTQTAFASPASEKQAEAEEALSSLNAMQYKLDEASNNYFTALSEQEAAQAKMDKAQGRIDEANNQIAGLQDQLGTRAKNMYKTGATSFLDMLLGASTFQAFTNNWDLLNNMNENDAEMVQETKNLRQEVEAKKAEYAEQEAVAAAKADEAAAVRDEAEALVGQMQATYDSLSAEAAQLLEEEKAAQEAENARRAQAELAAQQAAAAAASADDPSSAAEDTTTYNNDYSGTLSGSTVVERAYNLIGRPYVWGATGPSGFDCSGLVSACLSGQFGVRLGTTHTFLGWTRVSDPQPGDICVNAQHCGIYIGGGQMIHAPQTGETVKVGGVQAGMVYVRY